MTPKQDAHVARWTQALDDRGEASWSVTESSIGFTAVVDVCSSTGRRVTIARTGDTDQDAIKAVEERLIDVLPGIVNSDRHPAS